MNDCSGRKVSHRKKTNGFKKVQGSIGSSLSKSKYGRMGRLLNENMYTETNKLMKIIIDRYLN